MTAEIQPSRLFVAKTRRVLKVAAQSLPTKQDTIIVASFGRAGSALLYDAVAEAMAQRRYGHVNEMTQKVVKDGAFDLGAQPLRQGVVYKTHDYPDILAERSNVYGPIDEDLAKLPDCFAATPAFGKRMQISEPEVGR